MNESIALEGAGFAAAEPVSQSSSRVLLPFEFRGSGGEYFRIWIVNLLLTIVTLGIYSAWAKVRRLRYFYGNTYLDGQSFEYHGRGLAILKGRLVVFFAYIAFVLASQFYPVFALLLMIPIIIFLVPWIIQRSRIFQTRMSSYRNLRFDFHGTYGGALGAFIGWYFIAMLTLGTMTPSWVRKRVEYTLDNVAYGTQRFSFLTNVGRFYAFCYITFGMALVAYLLFIFLFVKLGYFGQSDPANAAIENVLSSGGLWLLGGMLLLAVLGLMIYGYYEASFLNASYGGVQIGSNYVRSQLKIGPLVGIYVTNLLGIVFTLGLFYPWAKVRQARYQLENTAIDSDGNLSAFTASASQGASAFGQEAGDFFDVDFGL